MAGKLREVLLWLACAVVVVLLFVALHDVIDNRLLRMMVAIVVAVALAILVPVVQVAIRNARGRGD